MGKVGDSSVALGEGAAIVSSQKLRGTLVLVGSFYFCMLCCISTAQGASVLFVVHDASSIWEHEVEYKYRLEQAGYNVIPMTYSDVTSSINLSGYGFVYWTDFTGEGISDPYADVMIDELVEQAVPFMSPNPKFAIKWGLGTNAHPYIGGTEWLWDQTDITVLDASHPIFNDIFSGSLQVYRFGDIFSFIGVLADDSTLSPDAVKLASTYNSFYNVDELSIIEFPAGATQTDLSAGHAAPTAKFIHMGMGDETPDTNPYPPFEDYSRANDHENFWEIFVNAAYYLAVKPLRLEAGVSEDIEATFNGQGSIIEASTTGKLILLNKEAYPGKYGFNITLGNTNHTDLSETYYVGDLAPGENPIADYQVLKDPHINLTFDWSTSFDRSLRYGLEETIDYEIIISNPSPDDLRDVSMLIPLPENLSRLDVLGVEPSNGLLYDAENEQLTWTCDLESLEEVALSFRVDVKATDPVFFTDRVLRDVFEVSVEYEVDESLSGLTVEDVAGNEFYVADLEESSYATSSRVSLTEDLDITILSKTVLAWTTDDPNAEFIEKLAEKKPDVYFDSAHTKAEFFSKLRNGFYSVIFLANTKSANELTDPEINEIKGSLSSYDSIGKGLIVSGFGLKYAPELGGVVGGKYIGSLPMGEKFEIRPVVITEAHPITQGYEGTELSAVGWAVRVVPESSVPLARFEDIMPGNARGKPSHLKELPAVTVSAYGSGSGVLFAPDIGASSAEGFNEEEWFEMASRAIDWISASSGVGASIGIEKDANPKSITVKTTPSDKSNDNKHAKVRVTVKNTGSLDLFNVYVAETLPAGLTLINGTLNKSVGTLNVGDSYTFNYSFWMPADYPTTYELVTTVTSTDSRGKEHSFEQSLYLEVELPPGVNISRYKDNGSSIRIVKRLGKQGDKTKVTIDLLNRDKLPVKGVWIEETIPEEVYKETHTGVFSNNGLFWDLETVEKKASVEYFLRFPDVDEPTTYELKTVVEYQTLEDFKTLEEISYVTISPKGDIDLTEGKRASKIIERGKGYSKVHMGSRHTKWGGGTSHGKKKGHDKDKGKPDKPPKDKDPGKGKKH